MQELQELQNFKREVSKLLVAYATAIESNESPLPSQILQLLNSCNSFRLHTFGETRSEAEVLQVFYFS